MSKSVTFVENQKGISNRSRNCITGSLFRQSGFGLAIIVMALILTTVVSVDAAPPGGPSLSAAVQIPSQADWTDHQRRQLRSFSNDEFDVTKPLAPASRHARICGCCPGTPTTIVLTGGTHWASVRSAPLALDILYIV